MRERPPHIIILPAAGIDQLSELRNNRVPASASGIIHPEPVVDLLAPVKAENDVAHFPVAEVYDVAVDKHTVRREGEAEVLPVLLPD